MHLNQENRIKIARIQSRLVVGGPSMYTVPLSHYMDKNGYEIILIGGDGSKNEKSIEPQLKRGQCKYYIIPEMGREIDAFNDIKAFIKLIKILRKEHPAIIETHTAKAGAIGRLAAIFTSSKCVVHTFHGHVFNSYFGKVKSKLFIWFERFLALLSDKIVVISKQQEYDIVHKYKICSQQKVELVELGFDWTHFLNSGNEFDLKHTFNIAKRKKVIAIIGRLVAIKNHALFLEIAHLLNQKSPDSYHFLIVGDGELKENLRQEAESLNLQDVVTFTGWQQTDAAFYKGIDLLLLTSLNEGTPVTIIEALVTGTPVISTKVGGVEDVMKYFDTRYLVEDFSKTAFVTLIEYIIKNNIEVLPESKKQVTLVYSVNRVAKQLDTLYKNIIDRT